MVGMNIVGGRKGPAHGSQWYLSKEFRSYRRGVWGESAVCVSQLAKPHTCVLPLSQFAHLHRRRIFTWKMSP